MRLAPDLEQRIQVVVDDAVRRAGLPDAPMRKYLREQAHLSQRELGELCGVSAAAVSRWENGLRTPRGPECGIYAEVLAGIRRGLAA